jgi:hypothetical protein
MESDFLGFGSEVIACAIVNKTFSPDFLLLAWSLSGGPREKMVLRPRVRREPCRTVLTGDEGLERQLHTVSLTPRVDTTRPCQRKKATRSGSIASGHAFPNASPLNAPLLCQVTLFKMPAIRMHQVMLFKMPAL